METTTLGRTGAVVSRLGFGGAPAGLKNYLGHYDAADRDQRAGVIEAVRRAVEEGVTYFDTAAGYGLGASEEIFGEALADSPADLFLATKVSRNSFDDIRASLVASLSRLRRPCVDLLQLHGSSWTAEQTDRILAPGGPADQLAALREEGLLRSTGFTTEDTNDGVYRLIRSGRFDVMQICYNVIYQHPYEPTRPFGSILEADRAGMGVVTMRAMTSGIFQQFIRTANPNDTFDYAPALLQFVLSNPLVDVALVGMRTVDEVVANAAIASDTAGRFSLDDLHRRYVE